MKPGMNLVRQWAVNTVAAFRAGDIDDGVVWFVGFCERYSDVHTPEITRMVQSEQFEAAADRLEWWLATCL